MLKKTEILSVLPGEKLPVYLWLPEGEPRGVVQFVHGMAEHMERYDEPARYLNEQGWAVVGHTHIGHGENTALPGYFGKSNGWDNLLRDVHQVRQWAQQQYPALPYYLLGHSMGSFLVRCYLTEHAKGLTGAVISGTGYFPLGLTVAAQLLARVFIGLGQGKKPNPFISKMVVGEGLEWLSRDETVQKAYGQDPRCGFIFTTCGFKDLFTGLYRLAQTRRLKAVPHELPLYIFSGDADPVGKSGEGVKKVAGQYRAAGLKDVTLKLYHEGRHEMFNELNREEVYADLAAWLAAR